MDYWLYTSPRGFIINAKGTNNVVPLDRNANVVVGNPSDSELDAEFGAVWEKYRTIFGQEIPLNLILATSSRFAINIPNFKEWCYFNAKDNKYLSDYGLEFIKDCILFAQSGHRKYPLTTWYDLLESYPKLQPTSNRRVEMFSDIVIPDTDTLIKNWCSQKHGIEDFINACHILFLDKA